ncbi:putative hydrolase, CocE/NonD family [Mycolicibacterium rhodesiae NBB3]|jgi:putative CocE/NonD family hydrolase|uniref:Putative hydrolase, CocE/NonD family n=1 Tax=Mycolicibacterium rhodesiae (strain NBB3) TaxID=710685 RepID=G8RLX1_MYCRN|nr:CocE/NonD family hydrolase [Mycolicibacterium rhodesiae]AEV76133.1 putative hydrolase, CocE/NonD family [Mycolicibacterium rhodesiae NBB3]
MTAVSDAATALPAKGKIKAFTGRTLSRLLHLPPQTSDHTVHHRVRVPMRDGVELLADHYEPTTATPVGTLLVRCPYGRGFPFSTLFGSVYATRGYHVVFQSVRGTFGSGGDFDPMVNEIADGADTVEWLRHQPWFTGSFATIGLSYLGFTQWALLADPPPEMKAAVITVGPHDVSGPRWGPGSFGLHDFLGWSALVARQEDRNRLRLLIRQARSRRALARATTGLPAGQAGRKLLGDGATWWEDWLSHPEPDDPFWANTNIRDALKRTDIPVLLIGGWQDLFLEQTLAQYSALKERGVDVATTVGSWTHTQVMSKGAPTVIRETLDWLDAHLGGRGTTRRPVRIEMKGEGWIDLSDWPPTMPERVLYLQPTGRLGDTAPPDTAAPMRFTYNPVDPTPTIGGRLLSPEAGYRRDTKLAERPDVLCFTGDRLPTDLYVVGTPFIELSHSCDNPYHDLFVRISEVDAKDVSRNVSDGYRRSPTVSKGAGTIRIDLDSVAHRFRAGSRIRVLVAGGSHPRFARNLGTSEPLLSGRELMVSTHTIHLGEGGVSRLVLPAGSQPPSGH